jgi:hypothetical protein
VVKIFDCTIFAAFTLRALDNLSGKAFLVETFLKRDEKSFPHGKKFRARMLTRINEESFSHDATQRKPAPSSGKTIL